MEQKRILELIHEFKDSSLGSLKIQDKDFLLELTSKTSKDLRDDFEETKYILGTKTNTNTDANSATDNNTNECEKIIKAPLVGVFYEAKAPGEPPFVKAGDSVKKGQILCLLEAMKVINELGAKEEGTIKEVLVKNGDPVEFGQPLFIYEAKK